MAFWSAMGFFYYKDANSEPFSNMKSYWIQSIIDWKSKIFYGNSYAQHESTKQAVVEKPIGMGKKRSEILKTTSEEKKAKIIEKSGSENALIIEKMSGREGKTNGKSINLLNGKRYDFSNKGENFEDTLKERLYSEVEKGRGNDSNDLLKKNVINKMNEKSMGFKNKKFIIYFSNNSYELFDNASEILDTVIEILEQKPRAHLSLKGYTDTRGNSAANKLLSEARANSVRQFFMEKGIRPSRIKTLAMGDESPIAGNDTVNGRKQNRRVEIEIIISNV
jgi:outer membrane protein OmpA-like peptidoglycan-associated protein